MRTNWTNQSGWQRVLSIAATVAASAIMAFALTACGDDETQPPPSTPTATVAAPGAPTAFTATAGENLVNLQWSPPAASATAGLPTSYVIYVSETANTPAALVDPANLLATVPVVTGQTVYTFTNSGLAGTVTYYYVVTAKNAGGETPSTVASAKPTGSPNPAVAGNNFSAALIFADDIGIGNALITGSWTPPLALIPPAVIDYNTGLRPLVTEVISILPSLTVPSKVDPLYFEQKSVNTWQGEWAKGKATPQNVTAKWGDNLSSGSLSSTGKIRLEMVLTKTVPTPMTTYTMKSLYGAKKNEMFGTNGVVIPSTTAFVFATNAHLQIHKLDAGGNILVDDQFLFDTTVPDGLNKLAAEIPVSGNFTYGYVWDPSATGSTAGNYRITFLLDATSQGGFGGPQNNTFMTTATNGVLDSTVAAHIDIVVQ